MRFFFAWSFAALLTFTGCTETVSDISSSNKTTPAVANSANPVDGSTTNLPAAATTSPQASSQPTPVRVNGGTVTLAPENTKIEFVGLHMPPREPAPRTGGFEKFTGKVQVDPATKALKSISVDIDTTSIWTEIQRLTDHLKSADFFEVREFPTAKFESTRIEPAPNDPGQNLVTGNLTLHGVTKEIRFPATITVNDAGLTLTSTFTINRADFGMTYGPTQVENAVTLNVVVGEKTQPRQGGGVGGGGGGKGGRKGNFDPAQAFARQDANGDGKLTGDEVPQPMRDNVAAIDTDGDGGISLAEYEERMRQFRATRGGKTPDAGK